MTDTVDSRAAAGRVQVHPGDTVASTWGNLVFDQSVQAFATAADRDSQWPSPNDGAVCYTADAATVWARLAGMWRPVAGPGQPAVTTGGIVTATDANGNAWVAKPGVNAGAWRKARDVLHCRYYKNATWNSVTTAAAINFDTLVADPYGLYASGTGFTAPAAGWYRLGVALTCAATASGQWFSSRLMIGGTIWLNTQGWSGGAAQMGTPGQLVLNLTAGQVVQVFHASSTASLVGGLGNAQYFDASYLGTG